ncbi:prolyl oligopeptidase family serine peptidase [Novosphingobium sp. KCTC 2891]|uniref:prolyl oligopeptidase family serine peptidase n=1 Tax=Novosphingobium sp. KCTC 2891 TaxID=2989730 RepID=UPI00222130B3|nr:prolyl oligopeptidase family serine peptidase [Novosphingobium sp. KCTC 2891]MCW1381357.1 prolyl oligopeptidase family serine peptidase [Novosphingobium sp. KCTC 2891]
MERAERTGWGRRPLALLVAGALLAPVAPARAESSDASVIHDAKDGAAQSAPLALPRLSLPPYPPTQRDALVERVFGEDVADPYRWLEQDVRSSPQVAQWVARQNAASAGYLARLPGRDAMAARIRTLFDYERISLPRRAGKSYFYLRNPGLQNQPVLHVRKGLAGEERALLDPNGWSKDGTAALDSWVPSPNGRWLAYSVQEGGSDWRTIGVVDVRSGRVLEDRLAWANDTQIAWVGEEGLLYSRFPAPAPGEEYRAPTFNKAVWYHRIGTPQEQDRLVYATPEHPEWGHKAAVTADGRWAVISSEIGTQPRRAIHLIDLRGGRPESWNNATLAADFDHDWKFVDGFGDRLWFITNDGAPRYRLVQLDLSGAPTWKVVVPERTETLAAGNVVGDRIVLSYLRDGASVAVITDLKGRPSRAITLNDIGSATGFGGRPGDPETFYQFASFNRPPTVYRMDLASGTVTPFAAPKLAFDPDDYLVEQRTYPSKDGTKVPIYIVRKKSLAGKPAPTLLYGYGGFDIALTPGFSPVRMAWLESGGVFALANIRGGGEFGREWHDAGRLNRKQNSFDDFIAAGEFLIREGITPKGGLAVQGGSNGGLLVGAVVNQRPDLFAAANPDVGVMDMLRFDRFTAGRYWVEDYGRPERESDWKVLRAYSPYHNIRGGVDYPAVLVTTADTDDRVVPAHSFKYVAALQAAAIGDRPHLLRVDSNAGHGTGKPVDKVIAGGADVLSFLAYWTGLNLQP